MKALRINIILPFPVTKPVGGAKIMYEYANRLFERGHQVSIFHSTKRPFKKSHTPLFYKQFVFALRGVSRPKWFALHKNIRSIIVPEITDRYIPDADIILSTWWQMTYSIDKLSGSKGKKFNLIQDYEIWNGRSEQVDNSFLLKMNHLAISHYLQKVVQEKNGHIPEHIPNGIDTSKFFPSILPKNRNPYSVIMMYSDELRKGSEYGLHGLQLVKDKFQNLEVILFGVCAPPKGLPSWMIYHQRPGNLPELYNRCAVFLSPSLFEGWGLPIAEAMASGCAVVCTDSGGPGDFAYDNETAIIVRSKDTKDIEEKISCLFNDENLRLRIAEQGLKLITTTFTWEKAVLKIENCFYTSLKSH